MNRWVARALAPLRKMWRQWQQVRAESYYEGPECPARVLEQVQLFRMLYPTATPQQWADMCRAALRNAYQEGWVRGYEHEQRGWKPPPALTAEQHAELLEQTGTLADRHPRLQEIVSLAYDPADPLKHMTDDERRQYREYIDALNRSQHRVDVVREDPAV